MEQPLIERKNNTIMVRNDITKVTVHRSKRREGNINMNEGTKANL